MVTFFGFSYSAFILLGLLKKCFPFFVVRYGFRYRPSLSSKKFLNPSSFVFFRCLRLSFVCSSIFVKKQAPAGASSYQANCLTFKRTLIQEKLQNSPGPLFSSLRHCCTGWNHQQRPMGSMGTCHGLSSPSLPPVWVALSCVWNSQVECTRW